MTDQPQKPTQPVTLGRVFAIAVMVALGFVAVGIVLGLLEAMVD